MVKMVYYVKINAHCKYMLPSGPLELPVPYTFIDGKRFYLPHGGCSEHRNDSVCKKCQLQVATWFIENDHPSTGWPDPFIIE